MLGRLKAHQAKRIGADVALSDVVTPDDDDVRLVRRMDGRHRECAAQSGEECILFSWSFGLWELQNTSASLNHLSSCY